MPFIRYSLLSFFLCIASIAQSQIPAVRVNPIHDNFQTISAPALQVDSKGGIYCAWVQPKKSTDVIGPVLFSYSPDGKSFTTPISVVGDADAFSDYSRAPSFIIDTNGFVHITWMGQRNQSTQSDIWYSWSFDKGLHWAIPVTIIDADDSSSYYQDFPSLACDSNSNLYATFIDYRETQRKHTPYANVFFTRSFDGGRTWSKNKKVDSLPNGIGGASEASIPKIESSPDGHLYVAYRGNVKTDRRIWLARSIDRGDTFEPSLLIQDSEWYVTNCPGTSPAMALDKNETAHIVWRDARIDHLIPGFGDSHLYYAAVSNGSLTSPKNLLQLNPEQEVEEYPDISIFTPLKERAISYQTNSLVGRFQIYQHENTSINYDSIPIGVKQRHVLVRIGHDGSRNFVWLDTKENHGDDLFYWKDTSTLQLGVSTHSPSSISSLIIQNNPAFEQTIVKISSDIFILAFIATDLLSRSIAIPYSRLDNSNYRLDLHSLSGGSYILSAQASNSPTSYSAKLVVLR